jgi:hypothetical protein
MLGSLLALAGTLVDQTCPCYRTILTNPPGCQNGDFRCWAPFRAWGLSALGPLCAPKQTFCLPLQVYEFKP